MLYVYYSVLVSELSGPFVQNRMANKSISDWVIEHILTIVIGIS